MSGVFLIVQETKRKPNESVLKPTKGGYPHITLVYSGDVLKDPMELTAIGKKAFDDWLKGGLPTFQLTAANAILNDPFPEKRGGVERERHDVLLRLTAKDAATVNRLRSEYVPKKNFTFYYPHVTYSVHYDKDAAAASLAALQDKFPIEVQVTGYTID